MINKVETYFVNNIHKVLNEGCWDENPRAKYKDGKPAHSKFITQVYEEYDLSKGEFPITELRPIAITKGIGELLWIYSDQTSDLTVLEDKYNVRWWRDWEVEGLNSIGRRYGDTIKRYDLMNKLLDGLSNDPFGRSHIISLWQEEDLKHPAKLNPCAFQTMWSVRKVEGKYYIDMTLVQRSSDAGVANHINKMQYVALQMMVAKHCSYEVGKFAHIVQNFHIYDSHLDEAKELIRRYDKVLTTVVDQPKPKLILNVTDGTNFYDIKVDDFELIDYEPIRPQLTFALGI
ncbi:thymidylate synthase [Psychrobacillus phage Perkons]|nr:thymidylate synthase [Psychrobacillus phage Perkons]